MSKHALKIVAKDNIDYTYNGKVVQIKKGDEFVLYGKVFAYKDALIDITQIIDLFEVSLIPEPNIGKLPMFIFTANLDIQKADGTVYHCLKGQKFTAVSEVVWFEDGVILNIAEHTDCIKFFCYAEDYVAVSSVALDSVSANLAVNGTKQLVATISPNNSTVHEVEWSSSDNSVATVVNGLVTAKKAGTATITASADGKSATCAITVA